MTNEEAIKELQSMCDHLHAHGICDKDSNMLTACKMAISALEQMPEVTSTMQTGQFDYVRQPCEDVVSREDALKSLIENTDFEGWELSQALEAIEKLPSVTRQTGKWIDGVHAMGYREGYKDAQKQKSGKWIIDRTVVEKTRQYIMHECGHRRITNYHMDVHCSECGFKYAYTTDKEDNIPTNFCPNCGCRMVEPQESEDKE